MMNDATRQPETPCRVDEIATVAAALAYPDRVRILTRLSHGEATVSAIQTALRLQQPTLSQNLNKLRRAGLVHARRRGRWIDYSITATGAEVLAGLHRAVAAGMTESRDTASPERRTPSCAPDPDAPAAWLRLARPALAPAQPRRDEETVASR